MAPSPDGHGHGRPGNSSSPHPQMPDRPRPSADQGIKPPTVAPADESDAIPHDVESIDIFTLPPLAALRILTGFVEALIRQTSSHPSDRDPVIVSPHPPTSPQTLADRIAEMSTTDSSPHDHHHEDVPPSHKTPIGSPETHPHDHPDEDHDGEQKVPALNIAAAPHDENDIRLVLARKFSGKSVPPIPLIEYMQRLHKYCPMSTAVYLAAGVYIEQLVRGRRERRRSSAASRQRADTHDDSSDQHDDFRLPLHSRNAHRILLAALRIATKLLEDLSYAHARFARVGGIAERELTRLELNFLFLVEFRTVVGPTEMQRAAMRMRMEALESIDEGDET